MKNKILLILLILSAFFLFACGLTDNLIDKGSQIINNRMAESAPDESIEPLLPQEQEPQAVQVPQEPEMVPTEKGEPEAPPIAQFDLTSACDHPYFPIREGAYWRYQETAGEGYTLKVTGIEQDKFTLTQEMISEDVTFSVEWFCSENGILSGSFSQVDLLRQHEGIEGAPEMTFETLEWEGETLPAEELMNPGYSWTSNYKMNADIAIPSFEQNFESIVTVEHEIVTIEEVVVPAGTFPQAVRVDSLGVVEMIVVMGETTIPFSGIDFAYSTWYVEGVGMVKSSNDYAGMDNLVELKEYGLMQ